MTTQNNLSTANFCPERLRMARYRACLSIRQLAERTGVSHPAISQYETGRGRPSPTVLKQLALATGVSMNYLTYGDRPVSMAGLEGTHFRSLRSTTKQNRVSAWVWSETILDLVNALEKFVRLPEQDLPIVPLESEAKSTHILDAVNHLREHWELKEGPVGYLVRQMERHGVIVSQLSIVDDGIDAFSQNQGSHPVVVLGTNKDDLARSRFDAAHELGHLICHPEADPGGVQETQAHAFAAELLMPAGQMIRFLPRRFDLGQYVKLKQEWGVSIAALLYRARTLEIISEAAYRRAVVAMNSAYGRRYEPFPLTRSDEPTMLATAVKLANQNGISMEQIASHARLSITDVSIITGGFDQRPTIQI